MPSSGPNKKKTAIYATGGLLLLSILTATWTTSTRTLADHEAFVSITAREMLQRGDWAWPTCNGEPRLQKPPLCYWLVMLLAKLTGQVDEFTSRAPSIISAVLSAAVTMYFANTVFSFRIAGFCTAIWATSLCYARYARNARPEMVLTFFITMCMFSFYLATTTVSRRKQILYMLTFWISLGLGMLAKGPAPIPLVFVPLLFYFLIFKQWKLIPKLLPIAGTIIFLFILLPWPVVIANRLSWDLTLWKHEFVDRFFGTYAPGNEGWHYYLPRMFLFIAPWVAFLPMALAAPFYKVWKTRQAAMQFLWLWFVADLVFLTISGGKRQHYMLPAMPPVAILIGILLEDMVFSQAAYTRTFSRNVLRAHTVAAITGAAATTIVYAITKHQMIPQILLIAATVALVATITAIFFAKGKKNLATVSIFAGYCIVEMVAFSIVITPQNNDKYIKELAPQVTAQIPEKDVLTAYPDIPMRFIHYYGRNVSLTSDLGKIWHLYQEGTWIIATGSFMKELIKDGRFEVNKQWEHAMIEHRSVIGAAIFHRTAIPDNTRFQ